jgi:RHS repeat-associated protein
VVLGLENPRRKITSSRIRHPFPSLRERDDESSLMHFRARSYDPRLGRFVQKDPVVTQRVIDAYNYATNNPALLVDPTGAQPRHPPFPPIAREFVFVAARIWGESPSSAIRFVRDGLADESYQVRDVMRGVLHWIHSSSVRGAKRIRTITSDLLRDPDLDVRHEAHRAWSRSSIRVGAWLAYKIEHLTRLCR